MNQFLIDIVRYTDELSAAYGSGDATLDCIVISAILGVLLVLLEKAPAETSGQVADPGDEKASSEVRPDGDKVLPLTSSPKAEAAGLLDRRLGKTSKGILGRLKEVLGGKTLDPEMVEDLEYALLASDLGPVVTTNLLDKISESLKSGELSEDELKQLLISEIETVFEETPEPTFPEEGPRIIMIVGVNGAGKTTSVGKLAKRFNDEGKSVLLVAGDTFRAAAVEQLQQWGERSGTKVVFGPDGSKPSGVVFDAMKQAKDEQPDIVLVDTAGRLHNKTNLMQELGGVKGTIAKHFPGAPHETWLVLDGTSGQNGLIQAREFNNTVPLTGVIVTKLDSSSKGGVVVAVVSELGIPVRFIGVGEGVEDLRPFNGHDFASALFYETEKQGKSAHAQTKQQKVQAKASG